MMKLMPTYLTHIVSGTALILALSTQGCGRKATPSMEATLVPGADFVARMDMASVRSSAVVLAMKDTEKETNNTLWTPFWTATGLTQDDVTSVLISMDLDKLDITKSSRSSQLDTMEAVMAFELSKPLTHDQLKAGIYAMDRTGMARPTDVTLDGERGLKSEEGGVICLVEGGRKVFLAPNEACMKSCLSRFKKGKSQGLSSAMTDAFKGLTDSSQIRAVVVLTDALQARLKADVEKQKKNASGDFGANMMINMLGPIADVKSLGLGMSFAEDFAFALDCMFSSPDSAMQMKATADMALGMMMMTLQQKAPDAPQNLAEHLKIEQAEKHLTINLTLTESELRSIQSFKNPTGVTP